MPSPELQSPFSCTWKPCSAPGLSPDTVARTRTSSPSWVKVTVPRAEFPVVGSRVARAVGLGERPSEAQPAAANAATSAAVRILFIAVSVLISSSARPWACRRPSRAQARARQPRSAWAWESACPPFSCCPGSSSPPCPRQRSARPWPFRRRRRPWLSCPRRPPWLSRRVEAAAGSWPTRRGPQKRRRGGQSLSSCASWSVSRGRLRAGRHDLLRTLALLHFLVPERVVLARPLLVDVAVAHAAVGAFHADRADIDMAERSGDEQQRRDRVDHVRLLHHLAPLVPVGEVEDQAGHAHDRAQDHEAAPEPRLPAPLEPRRVLLAERGEPLDVARVRHVVLHVDQEHHHDREDEERSHEVVDVLRHDQEPRETFGTEPRQDEGLAPEDGHPREREEHEADGRGPVRYALDRVEALDQAPGGWALQLEIPLDEVEQQDRRQRDHEQPAAVLRERTVVKCAPLAPGRLDQEIRFAPWDRRVLRSLARAIPGSGRVVPSGTGRRALRRGDLVRGLHAARRIVGHLAGRRGGGRRRGSARSLRNHGKRQREGNSEDQRAESARACLRHEVLRYLTLASPVRRYSFWYCARVERAFSYLFLSPLNMSPA